MPILKVRHQWAVTDIFLVPNSDGRFTLGQVIAYERRTLHSASCAFFSARISSKHDSIPVLNQKLCFSTLLVTPESLDEGMWPIVGSQAIAISKQLWPYEKLLSQGKKKGTKVRGSAIVDEFLNAYWGLRAWDDWYKHDYLDEFLLSPDKKPQNLIYVKS